MIFNQFPYTDFHELNADWIIKHFKEFIDQLKTIDGWIDEHQKEYEELKEIYDTLYNGTLTPALQESLRTWVTNNITDLIGDTLRLGVYFKLTDEGYFTAFTPQQWSDLQFNTTGLDIWPDVQPEFGHLCISY